MSQATTIDFYADKSGSLPRFTYRRLANAIKAAPETRAAAIAEAIAELQGASHPELRKFKFILPGYLRALLTPAEVREMDTALTKLRERGAQLKMVFPPASDEFSVSHAFLDSVFDLGEGPILSADAGIYTVGSCFARNIAVYLSANGRPARTYPLSEDLNSPMSNAFLFDMVQRSPEARAERMKFWLKRIYPELGGAQLEQVSSLKLRGVEQLERGLAGADCVVLTLGNVIDFFAENAGELPLTEKVLPKFVAMTADGDTGVDTKAVARLKRAGAVLRMATYQETMDAIACCVEGIRSVTSAPVVVTLSPVPVDALIGLTGTNLKSAVEVDCVSKSRLRSALDELWPILQRPDKPLFYYPSFEIVRWIAPLLAIPAFGLEDAASRHVSAPVLQSVCSLFADRFLKTPDAGISTEATQVMPTTTDDRNALPETGPTELLVPSVKPAAVSPRPFVMPSAAAPAGQASEVEATLVYGIANARTRTFPFPHIFVPDVFPPNFYRDLQRNIPDPSAMIPIEEARPVKGYKERFVLDVAGPMENVTNDQRAFWGDLGRTLLAGRLKRALLTKFKQQIETRLEGAGPLEFVDEAMLVEDITNYALGPHTDFPSKVITVLFYLPKDDSQMHLGTSLYTPKDPTRRCPGGPHYEREGFNRVATMPFRPNSMFAFVKADNSFHGVEPVTDPDVRRWLMLYDIKAKRPAA